MDGSNRLARLGSFLYTQNPFYLISCFLIIYGLMVASPGGDLYQQSALLAACMVGYSLLMSITVIGVVRLGKVWEDARSIFLVVAISHIALSIGFDLLCLNDWQGGGRFLLGGLLFSIASSEFVIRCCRIQFPFWYRVCYYTILVAFFASPVIGGYAVSENNLQLARWLGPIFSSAIGAAFLLLIPAVRSLGVELNENGTPWRWPWYPLSLFAVVIVGAGIRSHALWMSFGSYLGSVGFEPFLLLPIVAAIMVLVLEYGKASGRQSVTYVTLCSAPALLVLASTGNGMTTLSIAPELQQYGGASTSVALVVCIGIFLYGWMLRVRGCEFAVIGSLIALSLFATLPQAWEELGVGRWMVTANASIFFLGVCLQRRTSDACWIALSPLVSLAILQAGVEYEQYSIAASTAGVLNVTALMVIGMVFDTQIAMAARVLASAALIAASSAAVSYGVFYEPNWITFAGPMIIAGITLVYLFIVRRSGWFGVLGLQVVCAVIAIGNQIGWHTFGVESSRWPLHGGLLCFAIGLTITTFKSGAHRRWIHRIDEHPLKQFQRGL